MPKTTNSATISFTYEELVKLRDLQQAAWGRETKAAKKLDRAIAKLDRNPK